MVPARIVVGVDFSAGAGRAVREARALATRLGAGLEIVHIREGRIGSPWTPDESARGWLDGEGLSPSDLHTRGGVPWLELVRCTWSPGADLLVLGTHGRSGCQPLSLGSTAARVVLASPRPVVLVGERTTTRESHGTRAPAPAPGRP